MRAVLQRIKNGSVTVDGKVIGEMPLGILLLLGIHGEDDQDDMDYIIKKTTELRIFPSEKGSFDIDVRKAGGGVLVVSQFTLYGDCRKGRRPSFAKSAPPDQAKVLYDHFVDRIKTSDLPIACGKFGALMDVEFNNWGPVTLILDSKGA